MRLIPALTLLLASPTGWGQDWPFYGGDAGGRHYSQAAQINRDNVADLEVAWVHRSDDGELPAHLLQKTSGQATPILLPPEAGESLVYCSAMNKVMALDPATGELRWDFDPDMHPERTTLPLSRRCIL